MRERDLSHGDAETECIFEGDRVAQRRGVMRGEVFDERHALQIAGRDRFEDGAVDVVGGVAARAGPGEDDAGCARGAGGGRGGRLSRSVDDVRPRHGPLGEQDARLILAGHGMNGEKGFVCLAQSIDYLREGRILPGVVGDDGDFHRIDGARGAHGLEHEVEHRGKHDGEDERPYDGARREQQRAHGRFEGGPHGALLIAQLAAGDLEKHVV